MFSANMHAAAMGAPGVGRYPYQPYQNAGFGLFSSAPMAPMVRNAGYPPRVFTHPPNPWTQNRGAGNYVAAGQGRGRGKGNGGRGAGGQGGYQAQNRTRGRRRFVRNDGTMEGDDQDMGSDE